MGLKAVGLTIVGLAKNCKSAKNITEITNPIWQGTIGAEKFVSQLSKEETLAKLCSENGLVFEDVLKNLNTTSFNRLMELSNAEKIKLVTPKAKKRIIFLMNRNARDGLLMKNPDGVLNYLSEGKNEAALLLNELLALEKEGKVAAENISQLLKMHKAGYEKACFEFIEMLKSGDAVNNNVKHALLMVENGIPFEIFNPKNLTKFSKSELNEFALCFGSVREEMHPGLLNTIRAQLNSMVRVNRVPNEVSTKFLNEFDNIANTFARTPRSVEELSQAGGVQLAYSRDVFKTNVFEKIKNLPINEQEQTLEKFGLSVLSNNRMGGLPIFVNDTKGLTETELAINKEIAKFLTQNEIKLPQGFEEFKPAIEELCHTFPEFMFTIGLKQHQTHKLALSEHILSAFQHNVKNPLYKELKANDKKLLGIATVLHDINKTEKVVDKAHPFVSAQTTEAIVNRMEGLSVQDKNRIINFVENHHWLEKIVNGEKLDPKVVDELAMKFRSGDDFKMAKIFAESDLKAVNSEFWQAYGEKINSPMTQEIEKTITALQANGRMVYTKDVTLAKAIEAGAVSKSIGEGTNATRNYVIDAKQLGLDKENIIYHAALDDDLIGVASACGYKKDLVLSASLGRDGHLATYQDFPNIIGFRGYDMNNIGSAFIRNTKYGKTYDKFNYYYKKDVHFPTKVRQQLSFNVTDEQYAKVFKEASVSRMNEIHSNKVIQEVLGGEKRALEFEKAVANVNKELESTAEHYGEVVICDPEAGFIGTKTGAESISYELRKFCEEQKLPIVEFH